MPPFKPQKVRALFNRLNSLVFFLFFLGRFGTFLSNQFTIPGFDMDMSLLLLHSHGTCAKRLAGHSYHQVIWCLFASFTTAPCPPCRMMTCGFFASRIIIRYLALSIFRHWSDLFSQPMPSTNGLRTFIITKSRWSALMSQSLDYSSHSRLWISYCPLL